MPDLKTEDGQEPSEVFIGTYKTKEDAEKGFSEKENHIRRIEAENRLLREQLSAPRQTIPEPQSNEDDKEFNEQLASNFDDAQQRVVRRLIEKEVVKHVMPLKQSSEKEKQAKTIDAVRQEFGEYTNDPEIVEAVKNYVLQKADEGTKLNLYEGFSYIVGQRAFKELQKIKKEGASKTRTEAFVDGGGSHIPRTLQKGIEEELDMLIGKRDPHYGKMSI